MNFYPFALAKDSTTLPSTNIFERIVIKSIVKPTNPQYPKNGKPHITRRTDESSQVHAAGDLWLESYFESLPHPLPQSVFEPYTRVPVKTMENN